MISFKNLGGFGKLGNQLFQISVTVSVAKKNNTAYAFPAWKYNTYLENPLPILPEAWNPGFNFTTNDPFKYVDSPNRQDMNLMGYFQSDKYFGNDKELILSILKPKIEFINQAKIKLPEGRNTSVHIRRGDYLNWPQHHPIPSISYYNEGMERLRDVTDNFIIFSDDIVWCKNNIKGDNLIYSEETDEFVDLIKMSLCNNHIIANSSFSWWGSYLSNQGITIAPSIWVGPAYSHFSITDIYRKDMIII